MKKGRTTPCTPAADYRTGAPREDGWTDDRQALFLLTLAQTGIVSVACRTVEMSEAAAYMLRREKRGALFALGWKAAHFMARDVLADQVMAIARNGGECVVTKADGIMHRTTISTGPLLAVINRLDRRIDSLEDREMGIIRRLCAGFDAFIDVILMGGHQRDFLAFLKNTPDPLHHPLAQVMQMETDVASGVETEVESEDQLHAEDAVAEAACAAPAAPVAPGAAPAAKRHLDPIVVDESAIFSGDLPADLVRELAAMAAMVPSARGGVQMAA
jgi:hypothetical protein